LPEAEACAAGALGAVLDAEINDRWRRPTRAAEIREFCLTALKRPPDGRAQRDELWFDTSVTVRLVGYEGRRVGAFSEYITPDDDGFDRPLHRRLRLTPIHR
jgi:hypothetical protein